VFPVDLAALDFPREKLKGCPPLGLADSTDAGS